MGRKPAQADTRADPIISHMVDTGYLGGEQSLDIPLESHDAANEGRLSVNRAARRRNLSPGAWVANEAGEPCRADCPDPGAPHYLRVRLWAKNLARTHVFRETGGDPSKLKYNPWTSHKKPRHDDDGQLPDHG
jgi:hypothetical protein